MFDNFCASIFSRLVSFAETQISTRSYIEVDRPIQLWKMSVQNGDRFLKNGHRFPLT